MDKRIALYARVSTNKHRCRSCRRQFAEKAGDESNCPRCGSADIERSQTPETQLLPLRQYVASRGASQVFEYIDRESSGKYRPRLNALMQDARKRLFDVVVIVRFDRFARSTKEMLQALEEFKALNIEFVSLKEAIDTGTPLGRFFFTIVAAFAEFERSIIQERVRDGIERARQQGKRLGRPSVIVDREKIRRCAAAGQSIKSIAKEHGIARATVRDILGKRRRAAENLQQPVIGIRMRPKLIRKCVMSILDCVEVDYCGFLRGVL